jgi:hypothetical protein
MAINNSDASSHNVICLIDDTRRAFSKRKDVVLFRRQQEMRLSNRDESAAVRF